jgi:C1A family cysteine protease
MRPLECENDPNHAVTLVGYSPSSADSPAYFIIRNSWGTKWGENGHVKIRQGEGAASKNACLVEEYAYQPKGIN